MDWDSKEEAHLARKPVHPLLVNDDATRWPSVDFGAHRELVRSCELRVVRVVFDNNREKGEERREDDMGTKDKRKIRRSSRTTGGGIKIVL
jgi:hypothetical protein